MISWNISVVLNKYNNIHNIFMAFEHNSLDLTDSKTIVYTAMSKHLAYFKGHISKFVIEENHVPLNPFNVPYFMLDTIERDKLRATNNNYVRIADEIWVFGTISDGMLAEIIQSKDLGKKIRYFNVDTKTREFKEVQAKEADFEEDVKEHAHLL